jgi:hypothetical protein
MDVIMQLTQMPSAKHTAPVMRYITCAIEVMLSVNAAAAAINSEKRNIKYK